MDLTEKNRAYIDGLRYEDMLSRWRFSPAGDPWFQGETGEYWAKRMKELREQPGGQERHVAASKSIGW
ncbi:MAG TPA: hypothetical protein PKZ83_16780 [bacterium]|nr:hypothetical protein [bacterium]HQJ66287.1 hypothetical protein [bacterium]